MLIISLLLKQIMSENRKRLRREKGSGFFPGPDTVEVKWMSESQGRDKRKGITFYRYVQHAHTHTHTHTPVDDVHSDQCAHRHFQCCDERSCLILIRDPLSHLHHCSRVPDVCVLCCFSACAVRGLELQLGQHVYINNERQSDAPYVAQILELFERGSW